MYAPYNPQATGYLGQDIDDDDDEEETPQPYVKYRKVEDNSGSSSTDSSAAAIARHYNQLLDKGIKNRQRSRVYHVKAFNNWVKSLLISQNIPGKSSAVLDIAGGKGGDLQKYLKSGMRYVVIADIAYRSIRDAVNRFNEIPNPPFAANFICANCFKEGFLDHLPQEIMFDLVSCQFALHYSFETEEKARGLLHNISSRLKPGGIFVGTIPNANWLVKKVRSVNGTKFGNGLYNIDFSQKDTFPEFGCRYNFFLEDSVSCFEWLVNFHTLERIAADFDLDIKFKYDFPTFYEKNIAAAENAKLFKRMRVLAEGETFPPDEWEIAGLYMAFAFKKRGQLPRPNLEVYPKPKQPYDFKEIVVMKDQSYQFEEFYEHHQDSVQQQLQKFKNDNANNATEDDFQ